MKNNHIFLLILNVLLITGGAHARTHTRRTGKIEQALTQKKPIQVASNNTIQKTQKELDQELPFERKAEISFPPELEPKEEVPAADLLASMQKTEEIAEEEPEKIELQFEETDLQNFINYIEEIFKITFISNDAISPLKAGARPLKGNKISFKTNEPLSRDQVWNLFVTFLEISGFTVVQTPEKNIYRIEQLESARKAPLPAYLGVPYEALPDDNQIVRYLYFIENSTLDAIGPIVEALKSTDAPLIKLKEHKAFLITDKSYNVKTLMKIVKELDKVTMPQAMSVLKLKRADAAAVKKLYEELTQSTEQTPFRPPTARKQPTSLFFPENTRIITEPRTNSLILLGTKDAIKKIEEFIIKYVDVELDQPYSPLHMYQLKYADAEVIAKIMTDVVQLGAAANLPPGSVRGQDKFLKEMSFVAEKDTNRLIIKGDYNDYLMAKEIIERLDEQQPQVAIEVLIMTVEMDKVKELGAQIRSKVPGLDGILGQNVQFATSGMRAGGPPAPIITNPPASDSSSGTVGPGVTRLLGNLLNILTTGGRGGPGNSIISLGQDMFGVWGLLQVLENITNVEVISNPFVIATNKTPAVVSIGETRRVATGTVIPSGGPETTTRDDATAALTVSITPQINSDGMITLKLVVDLTQFTDLVNLTDATRNTKKVETNVVVADKEVIALGGLIKTTVNNSLSKTPILGDIPLFGWLFKNQFKNQEKDNLLILISTQIIEPQRTTDVSKFTQERLNDYHGSLAEMTDPSERRDPIHKLFFKEDKSDKVIEDFIFERRKQKKKNGRARKKAERNNKKRTGNHEELTQVKTNPQPVPVVATAAKPMPQPVPLPLEAAPVSKVDALPPSEKISRKERKSLGSLLAQADRREG